MLCINRTVKIYCICRQNTIKKILQGLGKYLSRLSQPSIKPYLFPQTAMTLAVCTACQETSIFFTQLTLCNVTDPTVTWFSTSSTIALLSAAEPEICKIKLLYIGVFLVFTQPWMLVICHVRCYKIEFISHGQRIPISHKFQMLRPDNLQYCYC